MPELTRPPTDRRSLSAAAPSAGTARRSRRTWVTSATAALLAGVVWLGFVLGEFGGGLVFALGLCFRSDLSIQGDELFALSLKSRVAERLRLRRPVGSGLDFVDGRHRLVAPLCAVHDEHGVGLQLRQLIGSH